MEKTIIVSGLPRSGLTATMQMLHAGGIPCFGEYPAFENYDLGNIPWDMIKGKAFKSIDTQLNFPPSGDYYVIRLRRNAKEQAKSFVKFLNAVGVPVPASARKEFEKSFPADYKKIDAWMARQSKSVILDFEEIINNPTVAALKIQSFLETKMPIDKMAASIKNRDSQCYDGMLETEFLSLIK